MSCEYARVLGAEALSEAVHKIDGPVLSAGATNGDRQIAAVGRLVDRDTTPDETGDVLKKFADRGLCGQKVHHRCIAAGEMFQRWIPMRIGQGPGVKHEVDVGG